VATPWRYFATVWGLRHQEAINGVANVCYAVATVLRWRDPEGSR
jgi:hypothetical protein